MKELRATVAEATNLELPEPVKLRRVTGRDILTAGLLLFALGALVPDAGRHRLRRSVGCSPGGIGGASSPWLFIVGETVFIPQAMGMMYAVGGQIPFWPLVTLQVAIMFIGLAVPSAAGRVAMNSAFLHKFGYGVTVSITQGALDSLSGFTVEASILLIALLTTDLDLGLDLDTDDVRWGSGASDRRGHCADRRRTVPAGETPQGACAPRGPQGLESPRRPRQDPEPRARSPR